DAEGFYRLYVSDGFENKVWAFRFRPGDPAPVNPISPGPDTKVSADAFDLSGFAKSEASVRYNSGLAPVYPAGLAVSADGETLYVANNLGDSLGVVHSVNGARRLERVDLTGRSGLNADGTPRQLTYPYGVVALRTSPKVYVSCWGDASVAAVNFGGAGAHRVSYVAVGRHPTAMTLSRDETRLYVVNSNADSVSVIETATDRELERIDVRLSERAPVGASPEGLALGDDESTLYVANAHSNSVAVVRLSDEARGARRTDNARRVAAARRSSVRGFIPVGQYPSAIAVVGGVVYVGNGKGTGVENSSLIVNNSGRVPNAPNERFPADTGRA